MRRAKGGVSGKKLAPVLDVPAGRRALASLAPLRDPSLLMDPPASSLLPPALPLTGAQANCGPEADSFFGALKAVDGSWLTHAQCWSGSNNWISVRTEADAGGGVIGSVQIYASGEHDRLGPFEVWVGASFGDTAPGSAERCTANGSQTISQEPTSGMPVLLACGGSRGASYVTLRQVGSSRGMVVHEIVAYANQTLPHIPDVAGRDIIQGINARYSRGKPSRTIENAGVLVHIFDDTEDWRNGRPWDLCVRGCDPVIDHFSASVINAKRPAVYAGPRGGGLVLSADADFLCIYDHDYGTGSRANGGCADTPGARPQSQLLEALRDWDAPGAYW